MLDYHKVIFYYLGIEAPENASKIGIFNLHKIVGIIILVFSFLLMVSGMITNLCVYDNDLKSDILLRLKVVHKYIGILTSWSTLICLITGGYELYAD